MKCLFYPTKWKKASQCLCFSLATLVLTLTSVSARPSSLVCVNIPCANGGTLKVSNSIWGRCRCLCPAGYVGPYCQYSLDETRGENTDLGEGQGQNTNLGDFGQERHGKKHHHKGHRRDKKHKSKKHVRKQKRRFQWPRFFVFGIPAHF